MICASFYITPPYLLLRLSLLRILRSSRSRSSSLTPLLHHHRRRRGRRLRLLTRALRSDDDDDGLLLGVASPVLDLGNVLLAEVLHTVARVR